MMEKALRGMETLYRRGIRYPISYAGAEGDVTRAFPMSYGGLREIEALRGHDNRLLLGVTGGIASGKTTVANMLQELGAPIVDFDLIARQVVEPGQPALKDIVDYFGKQVLNPDGTMDRKKVSDIVFRDFEKRKKLESFIHPRMGEIVNRQIHEYAAKDPGAIIQVVVPLMIELNLQWRYSKLLLVYIPQEKQIERLAKRDGISKEEAAHILKSQLSIDEKLGYADYVVHNDKSLEETRKQVEKLWQTLRKIQKEKAQ
jgi:dephospho-CoA kinase